MHSFLTAISALKEVGVIKIVASWAYILYYVGDKGISLVQGPCSKKKVGACNKKKVWSCDMLLLVACTK